MSEIKDLANQIKKLVSGLEKDRKTGNTPGKPGLDPVDISPEKLGDLEKKLKKAKEAQEDLTKATIDYEKVLDDQKSKIENIKEAMGKSVTATQQQKEALNEANNKLKEHNEQLKINRSELHKTKKAVLSIENEMRDFDTSVESLGQKFEGLTGTVDHTNTVLGALTNIVGGGKFKKAMDTLNLRFQTTFSSANIAATALSKFKEVTIGTGLLIANEFEGGITSFNKATGMLDRSNSMLIENSAASLYKYGVTFEDTSAVLQTFASSTLLATDAFKSEEVLGQVAALTKLGLSADTAAANMEILSRSFAMSAEDALKVTKQVAQLGIELGTGVNNMTTAFATALPRLALYSDDVVGQFAGIARAATKAGLSVEDVLGIGEQFQTFDSAATAAGRVNALIGGGVIDNITLMERAFEGPEKAAAYLQQQLRAANVSVESMSSMSLKALGEAIGITDASKLKKFLRGDLSAAKLQEPQVQELQNLNEQAKLSMTLMQQQTAMMKGDMVGQLKANGGTLTGIHETARGILDDIGGLKLALITGLAAIGMQLGLRVATRGFGSSVFPVFGGPGGTPKGVPKVPPLTPASNVSPGGIILPSSMTKAAAQTAPKLGMGATALTMGRTAASGALRFMGPIGLALTAFSFLPELVSAFSSEAKPMQSGVSPGTPAAQSTSAVNAQRNQAKHNHNQEMLIESVKENTAEIKRMNKLLLQQGVTVRVQ